MTSTSAVEPSLDRGAMRFVVVRSDGKHLDLRAGVRERGRDHAPIRLVDLPGLELVTGTSELVASRENRDPRALRADDGRDSRRGEGADLDGAEHRTGLDDDRTRAHVAAAWADVLPCAGSTGDGQTIAVILDHLDRDDRVGPIGNRAAGRDACGRTDW